MQIIKYNLIQKINSGTLEAPVWDESKGAAVTMPYSEANLEIAKKEAYNGEYTIEDDGNPDPESSQTLESRVDTLELDSAETKEALEMILSGVTE